MPEEVSSLELAKQLSASPKILAFLQTYHPEQHQANLRFLVSRGDTNKPLFSVFWRLESSDSHPDTEPLPGVSFYISLSGAVVRISSSAASQDGVPDEFCFLGRILDDQSASRLADVFKSIPDAADATVLKTNRHLLQALGRQARLHIESREESNHASARLTLYFQSSVVIGVCEYPLCIFEESLLRSDASDSTRSRGQDLVNELQRLPFQERLASVKERLLLEGLSLDRKTDLVQAFYACSSDCAGNLEDVLFTPDDDRVYRALASSHTATEDDDLLLRKLRAVATVQLADLLGETECKDATDSVPFPVDELCSMLASVNDALTPGAKLSLLRDLCAKCTSDPSHGADHLIPHLAFLLIRALPLSFHSTLRFIQRFAEPRLVTGESVYVMTNLDAVLEIVDQLVRERQPELLASDPRHSADSTHSIYAFVASASRSSARLASGTDSASSAGGPLASMASTVFTSIGNVPKAISAAVVSGFNRRGPQVDASSVSSVASASSKKLDHHKLLPPMPAPSLDLIDFRERILATNSVNDLQVRDLALLLEDYKSLLFYMLRAEEPPH